MPIGKETLNFSTVLKSDIRDVLSTKLSMFYYKAIAQHPCRLILYAPPAARVEPNRCFCYDDLFLIRFDPADPDFWFYSFLLKFVDFSISVEQTPGILIDTGKIVLDIDQLKDANADICVPATISDQRLIRHTNKQLHAHCSMSLLAEEELIYYDFSVVFLSSDAGEFYKKTLKSVVGKYPDYISAETGYAILSCLASQAKKIGLSIECTSQSVLDVRDEYQLSSFYAV